MCAFFRVILFFLFIFTLSQREVVAQTKFWVENQYTVKNGNITPKIDGLFFGTIPGAGRFGTYGWFQADNGYAQAYFGPTFMTTSWSQVGTAVGLEQGSTTPRFGSFFWAGKGGNYLVVLFDEAGGSGRWYKIETKISILKIAGLGPFRQAFLGTGVRAEIEIPKTPVKFWGVLTVDRRGAFAIRFNF